MLFDCGRALSLARESPSLGRFVLAMDALRCGVLMKLERYFLRSKFSGGGRLANMRHLRLGICEKPWGEITSPSFNSFDE